MVIHLSGEIEEVRRIRAEAEISGVNVTYYSERQGYHDSRLHLYPGKRVVRLNGRRACLSLIEYKLLYELVNRNGAGCSSGQLKAACGNNRSPTFVRHYIYRIRKKLEDDPSNPQIIITVPDGYMYNRPD